MTKLVCIVFVLLLATSVLAGHAQEPSAPSAADTLPFDTRQIYDTTMRADGQRAPVSLDPAALQLARRLVEAQDSLVLVEQQLLALGRSLSAFVASRNPAKGKAVRAFTEREILPNLFINYAAFRDLFAIVVADTFTVHELEEAMARGDIAGQSLDRETISATMTKCEKAASVLGGVILAQVGQAPQHRFQEYGLQ